MLGFGWSEESSLGSLPKTEPVEMVRAATAIRLVQSSVAICNLLLTAVPLGEGLADATVGSSFLMKPKQGGDAGIESEHATA